MNSAKEASERTQKSFEAYKTSKNELESLETELEEINSQITELEAKDNLTIYEKDELANLKNISAELEKQRDLQEKLTLKTATEAADNAYKEYQMKFKGQGEGLAEFVDELTGGSIGLNGWSPTYNLNELWASGYLAEYTRGLRDNATSKEEWDRLDKEARDYENTAWGYVSDLQGYLNIFQNLPESEQIRYATTIQEITDAIDGAWKQLDPTKWRSRKFDELFNNKNLEKSIKNIRAIGKGLGQITSTTVSQLAPDIAEALRQAGLDIQDFVDIINSELSGEITETSNATNQLTNSVDALNEKYKSFASTQSAVTDALKESYSATGLTTDSIEALTAAYSAVDGFDPTRLFERTANGIHLNEKYLKELNAELASNKLQSALHDVELLQEQIANAKANGDDTSALDNELIRAQQLVSQYQGLLSAYNAWERAKAGGNERDSYESVGSGYEGMKEILEQGWYGDESLNAYLDLLLGAENRTGDVVADFEKLNQTISGTSHSLMDYWQFDEDDKLVTDGLFDFLDDVNEKLGESFAGQDENGYFLDLTGDKIQQVAQAFGTSTEMIQLFARALSDAGLEVRMDTDETLSQVKETTEGIKEEVENQEVEAEVTVKPVVSGGMAGISALPASGESGESDDGSSSSTAGITTVMQKVQVQQEPDPLVINTQTDPVDVEQNGILEVEALISEYIEQNGTKPNSPEVEALIIEYLSENGVTAPSPGVSANIIEYLLSNGVAPDNPYVSALIQEFLTKEGVSPDNPTLDAIIQNYLIEEGLEAADPNVTANITEYSLSEGVTAQNPNVQALITKYIRNAGVNPDSPNVTAKITEYLEQENVALDDPEVDAYIRSYLLQTEGLKPDDPLVDALIQNYKAKEGVEADDPNVTGNITGYSNAEDLADPTVTIQANPGDTSSAREAMQAELDANPLTQTITVVELDPTENAPEPNGEYSEDAIKSYETILNQTKSDWKNIIDLVNQGLSPINAFETPEGYDVFLQNLSSLPTDIQISIGVKEENAGSIEKIDQQIQDIKNSVEIEADNSSAEEAMSETSGNLDTLNDKEASPTVNLNDNASGGITNVDNALTNLDGKTATTTILVQTRTAGGGLTNVKEAKAEGTLSRTMASGTAYNVINWRHAYSNGKIALPEDEIALVNELGRESLMTDFVKLKSI